MDTNTQPTPLGSRRGNNTWLWIVVVILLAIIIGGGAYLLLNKNDAVKSDNGKASTTNNASGLKDNANVQNQNNWSTMDQGPYKDKVSYATGTSLTSWTDSKKILAEHASVPDVVVKDGVVHVYFVDVSEDGKPEQVGHIQSNDGGSTWSAKTIAPIQGLGTKIAVDPTAFLLPDGRIRLYYFDIATTRAGGLQNNTIYSAISTDGLNFTEEAGIRFKYPAIFDPCVIKIGDTWRMYVGTDDQKVLSATSTDGLTFTYEGVALTGGAIPKVVYENGTYYLFTGGIEISTSTDGKTFTKTSNRFDSGALTADPGVVKISDGRYLMVYKTSNAVPGAQNPKPRI